MTMKFMKETINEPLKLNLQFFAEGDGEEEGTNPGDSGEGAGEEVKLTPEELQKKIESESDRKLAKALEKKQKEWEELTNQKIQEAIEEKERLSKLSEKERKEEEMTQKEKELAQREAEIERKILHSDAVGVLQENNLPSDFADFLLGEDSDSTFNNIKSFKKAFDEAVNAAVKEQLRQDTPKAGGRISGVKAPSVAELAKEARLIK